MASNVNATIHIAHGKRTSFSGFPSGNAAIFLEKSKPGIRGSTPDSEALVSSDEEPDQYHRLQSLSNPLGLKPARRSSWLTEVQQLPQRKPSQSGSGAFSPTSSHPATPPADTAAWSTSTAPSTGSNLVRGHSNSTSFPWGSASTIWNSDAQKGPPQRLTEVLPSPTSLVNPKSAGLYSEEAILSPPLGRDNNADSAIPFAIPLHPTLKTYRSQSYSVGQLDPESTNSHPPNFGGHFLNGRSRNGGSYTGLQHRPSRPSMLGELSHDASLLGQLREVEDDDESSNGSEAGVQLSTQSRTIKQLAIENPLSRQAATNPIESVRGRNRAITTNSAIRIPRSIGQEQHLPRPDSLLRESEYALYEADEFREDSSYNYEGVGQYFPELGRY